MPPASMQPTWLAGLTSWAIRVARALATSSWWAAWYLTCSLSSPSSNTSPAPEKGLCSMMLISLKVSQYFTRPSNCSKQVRA
ncbi:hypothetical protein D3C78_1501800 [compost metagenome]